MFSEGWPCFYGFPLLCSREPVFPRGKLVNISGVPVFTFGIHIFVAASKGMSLYCLALMANGAWFLGSYMTIKIGEAVFCQLPPSIQSTDGRLKHTTSFSVTESYWLALEL